MRAVVQRVTKASVRVDACTISDIGPGILVLVGICNEDTQRDVQYIVDKTLNLRIFNDDQGIMNKSVLESDGSVLVVSQFTLYADARKGRRPSYNRAAKPEDSQILYEQLVDAYNNRAAQVSFGRFQADMQIDMVNDGPVTILIDSHKEF